MSSATMKVLVVGIVAVLATACATAGACSLGMDDPSVAKVEAAPETHQVESRNALGGMDEHRVDAVAPRGVKTK